MEIESLFLSDVHLGSRHSKTDRLLDFLTKLHKKSNPKRIVILGDFVDGWKLQRSWYWNNESTLIIRKLFSCIEEGTEIIYVAGNHDEFLRQFCEEHRAVFGNIRITNEDCFVTKDGRRLLLTHGDQFDKVVRYAKWLSILGMIGYELLLHANSIVNRIRRWFKLPYWSLSKKIRREVKQAVSYLSDFEHCLSDYAKTRGYDGVICGHIHHQEAKKINGIEYYNTGDWVENCSVIVELSDGRLEVVNALEQNIEDLLDVGHREL